MSEQNSKSCRMSRVATSLWVAFTVASGAIQGPTDALADSPTDLSDSAPADPATARDLEAGLAALFDEVTADLDARVETTGDAIVQQGADQQTEALFQRIELDYAMRNSAPNRADGLPIATYVVRAKRQGGTGFEEERSIKIARGSFEISHLNQPAGRDERVAHGRYRFMDPFPEAPVVALGMRLEGHPHPDASRLAIRVVHADETGFDYEIRARDDVSVGDLTAEWVAYAPGSSRAPPTSAP